MQFYGPDRDSVFVCCKVMGFKIIFHGHCWVLLPKKFCDINFAILCLFYTEMIGFCQQLNYFTNIEGSRSGSPYKFSEFPRKCVQISIISYANPFRIDPVPPPKNIRICKTDTKYEISLAESTKSPSTFSH